MTTTRTLSQGFVVPGGSPTRVVEYAVLAEEAGWDAVFLPELGYGVDPWTVLAAAAVRTTRVRLGTMLTPLAWRRPWKLASQVATLDHLSAGRAVLSIGLGAADPALGVFGEPTDRKTRAGRLDEGIGIIAGLWSGERQFTGRHYNVDLREATALGDLFRPVQSRPPIWCVGAWPSEQSLSRVARCDGLIPSTLTDAGARQSTPAELPEMLAWLRERGWRSGDVVVEGTSEPADPSPLLEWQEAGATWWLETSWEDGSDEAITDRIVRGPASPRPNFER